MKVHARSWRLAGMLALGMLLAAGIPAAHASMNGMGTVVTRTAAPAAPDPIGANAGNFYFDLSLLELGGPMDLGFRLHYDSSGTQVSNHKGLTGNGKFWWGPNVTANRQYDWDTGFTSLLVRSESGDIAAFCLMTNGVWQQVTTNENPVAANSPVPFGIEVDTNGWAYFFDPQTELVACLEENTNGAYRVRAIVDVSGNQLTYTYGYADGTNEVDWLEPIRVEDNFGRSIDFEYEEVERNGSTIPCISTVTDHAGRRVYLTYEGYPADDWSRCLRHVVDANGGTNTFTYARQHEVGEIAGHRRPAGNTSVTQSYQVVEFYPDDGWARLCVAAQADAFGNLTVFDWDTNNNWLAVSWPDGTTNRFTSAGRHLPDTSIERPGGETSLTELDEQNRAISREDSAGEVTTCDYTDDGNVETVTNRLGGVLSFDYLSVTLNYTNPISGDPVSFDTERVEAIHYPDEGLETFAYDAQGRVTNSVDRQSGVTAIRYEDGWPVEETTPAGDTLVRSWSNGLLVATGRAGETSKQYFYDALSRITNVVSETGLEAAAGYDDTGALLWSRNPAGQITTFAYDLNGNLTNMVTPDGASTAWEYDAMDRMTAVTDARGNHAAYEYDVMGNRTNVVLPDGRLTGARFSPDGVMTNVIDAAGECWDALLDSEGRTIADISPMGETNVYQYDAAGGLTNQIDPRGGVTAIERDAMQRIVAVERADGTRAQYGFNAAGQLTVVTNPAGGVFRFLRGPQGMVTNLVDAMEKTWAFEYDSAARPTAFIDPLSNTMTVSYREDGRVDGKIFEDSSTLTLDYDPMGLTTQEVYSSGLILESKYDSMGRPIRNGDTTYAYDLKGNMTNCTRDGYAVGAEYDAMDRLSRLDYNGVFSVHYAYETAGGALSSVSNGLTGATWLFDYDANGSCIGIECPSFSITSTYTWVKGRLTRIQHGGLADCQYAYNALGRVTNETRMVPCTASDALTDDVLNLTYDDASQISSAGYTHDPRGRVTALPGMAITRDGASRATTIGTAACSYEDDGALIAVEESGVTNVLHRAPMLGINAVAAESDGTESVQRYYIVSPSGLLLSTMDNVGTEHAYFHDRSGNVLFLCDATGGVAAAYAYSPYGRLVASQGSLNQPYTFAGAWQVRRETDTDLYRMGVRLYDAQAGRFCSREPLWPRWMDTPSLNPYAYAAGDPVGFIDPAGAKYEAEIASASRWAYAKETVWSAVSSVNVLEWFCATTLDTVDSFVHRPIGMSDEDWKNHDKRSDYQGFCKDGCRAVCNDFWKEVRELKAKQKAWEENQKRQQEQKESRKRFEARVPELRAKALKQAVAWRQFKNLSDKRKKFPWAAKAGAWMHGYEEKGLWVNVKGQGWLFFENGQKLYHGDHGRILVGAKAGENGGEDVGIWLHGVQGIREGLGPSTRFGTDDQFYGTYSPEFD